MVSPIQPIRFNFRKSSISAWDSDITTQPQSPLRKLRNLVVESSEKKGSFRHLDSNEINYPTLDVSYAKVTSNHETRSRTKTQMSSTLKTYNRKSEHLFLPHSLQIQLDNSYVNWDTTDSFSLSLFRGTSLNCNRRKQSRAEMTSCHSKRPETTKINCQRKYSKTPIINIQAPIQNQEEKILKENTLKKYRSRRKTQYESPNIPLDSEFSTRYIKRSWKNRFQIIQSKIGY